MAIAFVPFPTRVISESGSRAATIFYALTMTAAALMLTAIWWHASHHNRLTDARLDARERKAQWIVLGLTVALFTLSIGLAFLDDNLARVSWILVVPIARRWHRGYTSP
jgi:TMEM175 potassium channel family protein